MQIIPDRAVPPAMAARSPSAARSRRRAPAAPLAARFRPAAWHPRAARARRVAAQARRAAARARRAAVRARGALLSEGSEAVARLRAARAEVERLPAAKTVLAARQEPPAAVLQRGVDQTVASCEVTTTQKGAT